ncbi:Snurportin-1 [Pseudolycoriella hygida]|uniref:Snurportin-1 n=1 Tax=Pseudolycoriella hygida TaxID=35572 RepID=A0A9Q0N3W8_9DIPT|nr:Snurportin-1 [Pseudolycoriella hygida]
MATPERSGFIKSRSLQQQKRNKRRLLEVTKQKEQRRIDKFLQFSQWMDEMPSDFDEWFMVPCPKGQRCISVAMKGCTRIYNKFGGLVNEFRSRIPGDNRKKETLTVLDCFAVTSGQVTKYMVLDVLYYANLDFTDCETSNDFSMNKCLLTYPMWGDEDIHLDGFMFYHEKSLYADGRTPLVRWLLPFMVREILKYKYFMDVRYMEEPADYENASTYIKNVKKKKKRCNNGVGDQGMGKEANGPDTDILEHEKCLNKVY